MRFARTAGQKGDAPQAEALLGELPAEVVMADAAYDSDAIREAIAEKGALAAIPNTPLAHAKAPARQAPLHHALPDRALLPRLKQFQRGATRYEKTGGISSPQSRSPPSSYGSGKCPQILAHAIRHS